MAGEALDPFAAFVAGLAVPSFGDESLHSESSSAPR
jgi:hypothetical protein